MTENNIIFFKTPKKKTKGSLKGPKKQNIIEQTKDTKECSRVYKKQWKLCNFQKQQWKEERRECLLQQFHQQWCFCYLVLLFLSCYPWSQLQGLWLVVEWVGTQISTTLLGLRASISTMVIGFVSSFSLSLSKVWIFVSYFGLCTLFRLDLNLFEYRPS